MTKFILGMLTGCMLTVGIAAGPADTKCLEWKLDATLYETALYVACSGDIDKAQAIKKDVGIAFMNTQGRTEPYIFELDHMSNTPEGKTLGKVMGNTLTELVRIIRQQDMLDTAS